MPISKIKGTGIVDNVELQGTEASRIPQGTTAQRANSQVGDLRYNSTIGTLEQYGANGWQAISSPPTVLSVSPVTIDESADPQTIVITGQNFDGGAVGTLVNSSGATVTPTTSTRNSGTQLTIVFSGSDTLTTGDPYDVKVTNSSGLASILTDGLALDDAPNWSTAAGSVGTVIEDVAMSAITLSATDPEGSSVSYSVTSGALPSGTSLGSSNGQITGTPNVSDTYNSSGVTHNFTVTANDGTGNTTPRAFSILRKWQDGSSDALAVNGPAQLRAIGAADGLYKMKTPNFMSGNAFTVRYGTYASKGWIEVMYSSDGVQSTPWNTWLATSSAGYDGNQSSTYYYLKNRNAGGHGNSLADGGLEYANANNKNGVMLLGPGFAATDVAITSKSSITANGVAASGANEGNNYPIIASSDLGNSDAATVKAQLALYFTGSRGGFDSGTGEPSADYNANWTKGGRSFSIFLAKRSGSADTDEWHLADGNNTSASTYSPNMGYRDGSGQVYHQANVGSWSNDSLAKASTYAIDASNVLSIWLSDE